MIMKGFDLNLLDGIYGLSCVENYFLYFLKEQGYSYIPFFFDSYLSFETIIKEFVENKAEYSSFYRMTRLQKLAAEYGLIDITSKQDKKVRLADDRHFEYAAIQVKPSFIREKYERNLWREDHFILLKKVEQTLFYLNDIPRDTNTITYEEIDQIYDGKILKFSIKKAIDKDLEKIFRKGFKMSLKSGELKETEVLIQKISNITLARDIIGILRISRKRVHLYLNYLGVKEKKLEKYLDYLDMIYNKIEYIRLRKADSNQKYKEILNQVYEKDKGFFDIVKKYTNIF